MDPITALTAFAAVFPAELPDKTMFAGIVLTARFKRPFAVWLGATAAFAVQMAIAVAAGQVLSLLPDRLVAGIVAVLFAVGAVVLLRGGEEDDDEAPETSEQFSTWRVVGTAFGVIFLAEWGDLTQLATASLAATTGQPLAVYIGALAALSTVAALATVVGRGLLRVVPERTLRLIAAGIFAVLALVALVEAIRG